MLTNCNDEQPNPECLGPIGAVVQKWLPLHPMGFVCLLSQGKAPGPHNTWCVGSVSDGGSWLGTFLRSPSPAPPASPHPNRPYHWLALMDCRPAILPMLKWSANTCGPCVDGTYSPGAVNVLYSTFTTSETAVPLALWPIGSDPEWVNYQNQSYFHGFFFYSV